MAKVKAGLAAAATILIVAKWLMISHGVHWLMSWRSAALIWCWEGESPDRLGPLAFAIASSRYGPSAVGGAVSRRGGCAERADEVNGCGIRWA